jgi:hypothetical protein
VRRRAGEAVEAGATSRVTGTEPTTVGSGEPVVDPTAGVVVGFS